MIDETMVQQLTGDVCSEMLGLDLAPSAATNRLTDGPVYCAHIGIAGDWQCEICVICTPALAQTIASTMFMTGPEDPDEGEIGDAVGELVNILGGNIKGVMPGENSLSLPSVVQIDGTQITKMKSDNHDVHFQCASQPMTVRYCEPVQRESTCTL